MKTVLFRVALVTAAVVVMGAAVFSGSAALAAKGGNPNSGKGSRGGGGSVTVTVPDGVFGGTTTATVSSPGMWVYNACSQNGSIVSQQWVTTDSAGQAVLHLGPTMLWTGGPASCVAQAGIWGDKGRWVEQGSTTFNVSG